MSNFFTNEDPRRAVNASGSFGIIPSNIQQTQIVDGITERGAGLGKLGSSMPTPLARLFLFSAALREVNAIESQHPADGHIGNPDDQGNLVPTPYHDLVGEMLDMLEFVFKYGDEPDFHVLRWNLEDECTALEKSNKAHGELAKALRSAFEYGTLSGLNNVYLFKWKNYVIGGTSPISLVYTSANLRKVLENLPQFSGDGGNILFTNDPWPLSRRDPKFREYLYRLRYTDLPGIGVDSPLAQLTKYISDDATNYDSALNDSLKGAPANYKNIKNVTSGGTPVKVAYNGGAVQLRMSDHTIVIDPQHSDYILKPTVEYFVSGAGKNRVPLALTKQGVDGLTYAGGRTWNTATDKIDNILDANIGNRALPGFGARVKYPFLTVADLLEDRIIEVSYNINRDKFFTGSQTETTFLLPLKKTFFNYFKLSDLIGENGNYTEMLKVEHDDDHKRLTVSLTLPLVNGHSICIHKAYSTAEGSADKVDCYVGSNTFDFATFPFYRLEGNNPDGSLNIANNVYNVMLVKSFDAVSMNFYEPNPAQGVCDPTPCDSRNRTKRAESQVYATDHIRVKGAFTLAELSVTQGAVPVTTTALIIPLFKKINPDPSQAIHQFFFSIDFGTTNTHVAYVRTKAGEPFGHDNVKALDYSDADSQVVEFNSPKSGAVEASYFPEALKRELVPTILGGEVKFPMRTATYQIAGTPNTLQMFFNTNIGFNYAADISNSDNYKTNIKWDRFDGNANERMSTYFAQILWMMKNKSLLNGGSNAFSVVVTYPISMRANDLNAFKESWTAAKDIAQCPNAKITYRTESIAPYYSYLAGLGYGEPYANMDIGGGTTDILYVNPFSKEANVFSAFFAANDLWNDGIDRVNAALKANGFVTYYDGVQGQNLGANESSVFKKMREAAKSSADIISYLFANEEWSKLSNTLRRSPKMMQLPVIHLSALAFYMAYALHMAEVAVPRNLSFTGMGSKYIKLISGTDNEISRLINAIFHYAGKPEVLDNSDLRNADVTVSFAPNPKEVTAIGGLISMNYQGQINPSEDIFYGFENEDTGKTLRYQDIKGNAEIQDSVVRLFKKFTAMFKDEAVIDVLSDLGYPVDPVIIAKLDNYAVTSLRQMHESSADGQTPTNKLKEPMFFWPLKNTLYVIGKELAPEAVNDILNHIQ